MTIDRSVAGENAVIFLLDRFPGIEFYVTKITFPQVTSDAISVFPKQFTSVYAHSIKVKVDNLQISFIVSEDFSQYFAFFNWMKEMAYTDSIPQIKTAGTVLFHDNHKIPIKRLLFTDLFPISLSSLDFNTISAEPLIATVTLQTESYTINDLTKKVI